MKDMLGREIKCGDIIATTQYWIKNQTPAAQLRLALHNVVGVAEFAISAEHAVQGKPVERLVFSTPQYVIIVHEADEAYPVDAPQPTLH